MSGHEQLPSPADPEPSAKARELYDAIVERLTARGLETNTIVVGDFNRLVQHELYARPVSSCNLEALLGPNDVEEPKLAPPPHAPGRNETDAQFRARRARERTHAQVRRRPPRNLR